MEWYSVKETNVPYGRARMPSVNFAEVGADEYLRLTL
jgi:hypothetical protein